MTPLALVWFIFLAGSFIAQADDFCDKFPQRQNRLTLGVLIPEKFQSTIGASIELALEHVHSTPDLIPDYCIDLLYRDTQVC